MIGDAIVAAEDGARDEAEKFFRFCAERAGFVGLMIEREEAFHTEMAAAEDFFV